MEYLPYGYLQVSREFVGYMYKIVDYAEFFRVTADRPTGKDLVTARFIYMDEFTKEELVLTIEVGGENGGWRMVSDEQSTDVILRCRESDLNAILLNSARLLSMVELGAVDANNIEAARRLDAALYYWQKPYSNTDF